MSKTIHIAGCCNVQYLPHLTVTFMSAIDAHSDTRQKLVFHLFCEASVTEAELDKVRLATDGCELNVRRVADEEMRGLPTIEHIPALAAWYRCFIPKWLPDGIDRILYLDCDILVQKDLTALYNMELGANEYVAAVANNVPKRYERYISSVVGKHLQHGYFNSGVLLMNIAALKGISLHEQVIKYAQEHPCYWLDQCALNFVLAGHWKRVSTQWNMQFGALYATDRSKWFTSEELSHSLESAAVIHFEGSGKPWTYACTHPMKSTYINYRKKSPWGWTGFKDITLNTLFTRNILHPAKKAKSLLRNSVKKETKMKIKLFLNKVVVKLQRMSGLYHLNIKTNLIAKQGGEINYLEARRLTELASEVGEKATIIEVGTLFGKSTLVMANSMPKDATITSVDNYCWNPFYLPPHEHFDLTQEALQDAIDAGKINQLNIDKEVFYSTYDGATPDLVFLDADHCYEETKKDIEWALSVGAKVIAGHDYCDKWPGVMKAVDEFGGPTKLTESVFEIRKA